VLCGAVECGGVWWGAAPCDIRDGAVRCDAERRNACAMVRCDDECQGLERPSQHTAQHSMQSFDATTPLYNIVSSCGCKPLLEYIRWDRCIGRRVRNFNAYEHIHSLYNI